MRFCIIDVDHALEAPWEYNSRNELASLVFLLNETSSQARSSFVDMSPQKGKRK